ncbi:MAG: NAD(P)-dependent oxidoreductase [Candidatus Marinimicrobia bacterium]|nr:NAD(P)-dependent oxidoreductase [Candidatus Neomarinimicrobiota bacterium]
MKKAVVVGGSGFIGSHVADHLSDAGYQVIIYDKTKSQWLRNDQEIIIGDVEDSEKLNQAIVDAEVVYNFAALSDINQALKQPLKTININIVGNLNVLEACRANKVKRFIYASTVYVHSREGGFYRCSKQASEAYVEEYQKIYGLDYTILRYGSLYGPRADKTNGLYRVVQSALKNGVVSYEGDIDAMREYIHVEDAARASIKALNDEFINESVVLTGQEPMKVIDMLKILSEILGLPPESVKFSEDKYAGHYIRTPYAYQPKLGRKYIPPMHVDLGQGLLQIINEINH